MSAKGFSLPELLAVIAMVGIAVAIGVPIVNEQVRMAEVRSVADELVMHLRTARAISVTNHTPISFEIFPDPTNRFRYKGKDGNWKSFSTPRRVRIAASSDAVIAFKANGSVGSPSTVIIESDVSGARERWTATVSTMGRTQLAHERVN